jgi:predicted dehydrogenase
MRVLIVGCGGAGRLHAKILKSLGFTIFGDDLDKAQQKSFCEENDATPYNGEDVDIVVVAVPPNAHKEIVLKYLEANKWVVCEKPFALTGDECDAMIVASKNNGKLTIAESSTYSEPAKNGPMLLAKTGRPCIWNAHYMTQYRPQSWVNQIGGGAFFEGGIHMVTTAKYLFGTSVKWSSSVRCYRGEEYADSGTIIIDYLSGDALHLSIFWGTEGCFTGESQIYNAGSSLIGPKTCELFGPFDNNIAMWSDILNDKIIVTTMMARNSVTDIERCLKESWR